MISLYPSVYFCPLLSNHILEKFLVNTIRKQNQYTISILLIVLVSGLSYSILGFIGYRVVAYILLVTLSILALFFDILPIMISALLSALIWDFFFIPPRFTFQVGTTEDAFLLAMYFIITMIHAVLTFKIKQAQKETYQKEEKANTLKLYNTLLNSLSHELRTPIATIICATDNLLMDDNKLSEENKENLLSEISVATLRLNQQVENLLNMSRLESGFIQLKKDWCDINELIYSTVKRLEENLKQHTLTIEIPENLPLCKLDAGLMEQVLYNLINNAIIYTASASSIHIKAVCLDQGCSIVIADNGPGFPIEEIEKVFDKFYRLKYSKTGGTGLGLSIAKGFVEAHGGIITLENVDSGGSLFRINIPTEISYINDLNNE